MTGTGPGSSAWPSILVAGVLVAWLAPANCSAQAPSGGTPGATAPSPALPAPNTPPPTMPDPDAPPTPGMSPGAAGYGGSPSESLGMPSPIPRRDVLEQPAGLMPQPEPEVAGLPSLSHDHRGDGSGTVGSSLIWQGQLPPSPSHSHGHYEDGDGVVGGPIGPIGHLNTVQPHSHSVLVDGTLGYGPPGLHPGFYGFGLAYHPGYGYGGNGLGVGTQGGYPCYGGPGYPFKYGYPRFTPTPFYEGIGQLYYDPPVVLSDLIDAGDFGPYTGASAYAYTHPTYTAEAAATGSFVPDVYSLPDTGATNANPEATFSNRSANIPNVSPPGDTRVLAQERYLGMDIEPATNDGRKGMKIVNVIPGSTAARAGLQPGDIIYAANGHVTQERGHLNWIITNATTDNILKLIVRKADGQEQTITIEMP